MAVDLDNSRQRLTRVLQNFNTLQLAMAASAVVIALVVGVAFVRWISAPQYALLFSNLSDKDASAVVEQLESESVPYQLAQGGSAILVPADQVDSKRLSLSASGIPRGSVVGFELLDNQGITTSSFREKIDYQRALQGELSRTISSMPGAGAAVVHLVMPEERLFSDEQRPASASVLLSGSSSVSDEQVQAITHLVASSVPDLEPANVTVTDGAGILLTDAGPGGSANKEMKLEAAYSSQLVSQADTMLSRILGPQRAVVRVNADLDFDERSKQAETYDPKKQVILRQTDQGEKFDSDTDAAEGPLTANPLGEDGTNGTSNSYSKDATDTQYGVSRVITNEKSAPGQVRRLTVAVVLDEAASENTDTKAVQSLVAAALGLDAARGDSIVVSTAKFDTTGAKTLDESRQRAAELADKQALMNMLTTVGGGAILLLVVLGLLWAMRRPRSKDVPLTELASSGGGLSLRGAVAEPEPERISAGTTDSEVEMASLTPVERVLKRADRHPDKVVSVLRAWVSEDEA